MTYHIVSILNEGAYISVDLGHLVCRFKDGRENRIPLADVRGIIAAHPAIAFSNAALARLLAQNGVVLHCDRHYKPVGWSVGLDRVVRGQVFINQIQADDNFKHKLWRGLSLAKMRNQAQLLTHYGIEHSLDRLIERPLPNEANVARAYWQPYFQLIGAEFGRRERRGAQNLENKALNYGYAVIATLVHRSVLIYGLLPSLGIHHQFRFRSAPLVYDVMEPCRIIVDRLLADWKLQPDIAAIDWSNVGETQSEKLFKDWIQFFMTGLRSYRLLPIGEKHSLKWLDAPDKLVRSVAKCYEALTPSSLWTPQLTETYIHSEGVAGSEIDDDDV